ncbi:MAG: GGDEF domain-containing protein, partial [Desulfobacterales bacterium]|nr:GGDEF domain-containing protein [Desulfobacterales bacterium]
RILLETVRETDTPCRYGSEEFAIILSNTDSNGAVTFSERFREVIENHVFQYNSEQFRITVSAGIASSNNDGQCSTKQLVEFSDKALYKAKAMGRNRVIIMNN